MKDSYGKRIYKCKCGSNEEQFVWQSELGKHKFSCSKCKIKLDIKNIYKLPQIETAAIRTPTKNR
jgi:hypothetical protein